MNDFEEKIRYALKKDIDIPESFDKTIQFALYKNNKKTKINYLKLIISAITTILFGTGIVFATNYEMIYEKIFKEPKQYEMKEIIKNKPSIKLTEEEKEKEVKITENEAKEIAIQKFNGLGFENVEIKRIELQRGNPEAYYLVKTEYGYNDGMDVVVNVSSGAVTSFTDRSLLQKEHKQDTISQDEAMGIAKNLFEKFGIDYTGYDVKYAEERDCYYNQTHNKVWNICFSKFYDGVCDEKDSIQTNFLIINGELFIESIYDNRDNTFESNKIVLSKEEAIEIAKNKEKEFSSLEIESVSAELKIRPMTSDIYELEQNADIYDFVDKGKSIEVNRKFIYNFDNNIRRKVWSVEVRHINYERTPEMYYPLIDYTKQYINKVYYIDCTTGEIIGGYLQTTCLGSYEKKLIKENTSEEYYNKVLDLLKNDENE